MASKVDEKIRESVIAKLTEFFTQENEEVLRTKSNKIAFPTVSEDGEEKFVEITVSIPKGANKGADPYDGYSEAESYALKIKMDAEKKAEAEKKKQKKIELDEIRRRKQAEAKAKREEKGE